MALMRQQAAERFARGLLGKLGVTLRLGQMSLNSTI